MHDVSYGDKAIEKLKAPVVPDSVDSQKDQINWWQLTSIQVISELKYDKAVKQLVLVLLTPTKIDLNATTRMALLKMAPAAEPELIKALNGQDPDYNKAGEAFKDKTNLAIVADTLALLSRTGGRDAILNALPTADTDTTKTGLAQALVQFPSDPRVEPAFLAAYNKLTWNASVELLGALKPRAALAQASASLYDANLTDWLVKETLAAPDAASKLLPIEAALKLMPAEQEGRRRRRAPEGQGRAARRRLPGEQADVRLREPGARQVRRGPELLPRRARRADPDLSDDRELARGQVGVDDGHLRTELAGRDARRAAQARRQGEGRERTPRRWSRRSTAWRRRGTPPRPTRSTRSSRPTRRRATRAC